MPTVTKTVLVVEDNLKLREQVCRVIRHKGMECLAAGTLHEGLSLLSNVVTMVLLDLRLPNGHGSRFVKSLVGHRDDLPVIVMTGFPEDRKLMDDLPFLQWLNKPFSMKELTVALDEGLKAAGSVKRIKESTNRLSRCFSEDADGVSIE